MDDQLTEDFCTSSGSVFLMSAPNIAMTLGQPQKHYGDLSLVFCIWAS